MRKRCRIDIIISIDKHDIATFGIIHPQIPCSSRSGFSPVVNMQLRYLSFHLLQQFQTTIRRTVVYRYNLITTFWDRRRYNTLQTSLYIGFRIYTGIIILISSITQDLETKIHFFHDFPISWIKKLSLSINRNIDENTAIRRSQ